jgi:hypothetical protein
LKERGLVLILTYIEYHPKIKKAMSSISTVIFFIGILWRIMSCGAYVQVSKEKLTENINHWYTSIEGKYTLEIKGSKVNAKITRNHPERSEEKDDLIEITYKGMRMQLTFMKPIAEITTHKDSLQKYFNYISIDKIFLVRDFLINLCYQEAFLKLTVKLSH